jgi:glucokinase
VTATRELIGVDVGGTKLAIGVLREGALERQKTIPTAAGSADVLVDEIAGAVEDVRGSAAAAVGVGVPSVVEFSTGRVKSSVNVKLADVPLRAVLQRRLGLPVFVDNDATCAALAEAHDGANLVVHNLVMITVGTGVGGGLVLGGRVYRGATGAAAEIGHTLIGARLEHGAPPAHGFPQEGSFESLASGHALDALALTEGFGRGSDVVAAALAEDARGHGLVTLLGQRLGIGIANAINTFDPEQVVIGGGVAAAAGELLLAAARESAQRFVLPGVGEQTEIRLARYGAEAGVRGAALLAGCELDATEHAVRPGGRLARSTPA